MTLVADRIKSSRCASASSGQNCSPGDRNKSQISDLVLRATDPRWHKHRSGLGVYRRAGVVFFWAQRTIEKAAGICALRLARFENGLSMKSIPASAVGGGASGASVGRNVADRQRLAAVLDGGGEFDAVMMASLRPGGVSRASRATVPDGLAD
jgi:hypothetical protein